MVRPTSGEAKIQSVRRLHPGAAKNKINQRLGVGRQRGMVSPVACAQGATRSSDGIGALPVWFFKCLAVTDRAAFSGGAIDGLPGDWSIEISTAR
jgi:hypothetical protein